MSSILVTLAGPDRSADVVTPGHVPIRDLIPEMVAMVVPEGARAEAARWAVGRMGQAPFLPTSTLDDDQVLDGTILYLRDMSRGGPPPTAPAEPSVDAIAAAPVPSIGANPVARDGMGRPLPPLPASPAVAPRWDLEPSLSLVGIPAMAVVLTVIWAVTNLVLGGSPAQGVVVIVALVGLFFAAVWWVGFSPWASNTLHLGFLRHLPNPPGLEPVVDRAAPDTVRVEQLTDITETLIFDLGRMLAGERPPLPYADQRVLETLQAMVKPVLRDGGRVTPNFGGRADIRVQWATADSRMTTVMATFEDRSTRVDAKGREEPMPPRTVELTLTMSPSLTRVVDISVQSRA